MTGNLGELPVHLKLQINNLVDLSTVAAIQNGNRSWVKIHSALWVNIQSALTPARKIDLLSLNNGVSDNLGQTALPAGHYTQLRLLLDPGGNSVVVPGSIAETPLVTPSAV